jgi:hypothetical protein
MTGPWNSRRQLVLFLIILISGGLIFWTFSSTDPASATYGPCDLSPSPSPSAEPRRVEKRGVLKPESPEGMIIPFGRSRDVHPEIFYMTLEEGVIAQRKIDELKIKKRPLRRQEVYATIFPEQYEATARITGPREATVRVCIPAEVARGVHPGTYSGGVVIADPRVEKTTVSITASLQFRRYQPIAVLFGLGVLIAGTISVWAAGRRAANKGVFASGALDDFGAWGRSNFVPITAGVVAALSAFIVSYWRNPSWGAKAPEDWLTLFGAMFSALTAAVVTTSQAGGSEEIDDDIQVVVAEG